MRLFSPMTLIVLVGLALCLLAGVMIILRSMKRGGPTVGACRHCGAIVRPPARFCSRCGADTHAS